MRNISIGVRLSCTVISIFVAFSIAFIVFQQYREKEFKIDSLKSRLQTYNIEMNVSLNDMGELSRAKIDRYVKRHSMQDLRVTLIDTAGHVFYDNQTPGEARLPSHRDRKEFREAMRTGNGYDIERRSNTLHRDCFYSATYFPEQGYVVRTSLPYNDNLLRALKADQHYLWFSLAAMLILAFVLYHFMKRLGDNITKLQIFATRADNNESLDIEDLADFPNDELGEIAERIIKLYKRLQETKEEQNIMKRQLTQNVAHELKTPVASIQGYLETIIENPGISEQNKAQFLQRCYAQSQRLTSLLQDISTLNRMDDAPMVKDFQPVDVAQVMNSILKDTQLQLQERKMTFHNLLPERLVVCGNPSLIYSIFRNLTDNAIAYAGERAEIILMSSVQERAYHFIFSDNGVGVGAEHLPHLFERFYRIDKGRSRKMGGTGLGLSIVKNAVLLHGGTIAVRNNEEGGLRFDFTFPRRAGG